ncbi:MAG: serine/threonine-protein kinase [Acidobacteria bacterium]|nr:serine/threonine-protein kinase [Acidobacteriota bacterium]
MSPEQWQRLETAVTALLTPSPGADAHLGGLGQAVMASEASDSGWEQAASGQAAKLRPGDPFGDWHLVRELDGGPLGTAWLAEGEDGGRTRQVVVKFVPVSLADPELRRQFAREIRLLARLQHPAIAELVDAGMGPGGNAYFILESVEGTPITEWTDEPLIRRVDLMVEVVRAVQFAHSQLVLHLDLQPSRVLVTREGQPKLLEFGLARLESEDLADPDARALATAAPSLEYASPEQLLEQEATAAADVYSLGLLAFELFTGQPARRWTELPERRLLLDAETWALPEADLPSDLRRMVERAAHPDPVRRYESASAFAEDLARFASGESEAGSSAPVMAAPAGWRDLAQRYRPALIGLAAVLVLLIAAAAGGGWQAMQATRQREVAVASQRKAEQTAAAQATARQAAERTRDQAVASRLATLQQRDAADARLGEVLDLSHATIDGTYRAIRDLPGANAATAGILRQTVATIEQWDEPETRDARIGELLADAYAGLAGLIGTDSSKPGELREAWTLRQKEIALRTRLIEQTRVKPNAERHLAEAHLDHWLLGQRLGQPVPTGAIGRWEGTWTRWLKASPRDRAVLRGAGLYYFCRFLLLPTARQSNLADAIRYWELEQKLSGGSERSWRSLALAYRSQANLPGTRPEARLAALGAARSYGEKQIEANPAPAAARRELAQDLAVAGELQLEATDYAAASSLFRTAAEQLRTSSAADPAELQRPIYLSALRGLAASLWKAQDWAALAQEASHWRRLASKEAPANDQALAALIEGDLAERRRDRPRACEAWALSRAAAEEAARTGSIFVEAETLSKRQGLCP